MKISGYIVGKWMGNVNFFSKGDSMADWAGTINDKAKDIWTNVFWKSPNHLWALKVTASIVFLVIGAELLLDDSFVGTTMALGVVAMALGETDVHPRGRMKSAGIGLTLFFVVSALVELLSPYPLYFALLICLAAFSLTLAGALNARMQGVTFGTLLIFVYTMLGVGNAEAWFHQPLLYTIGASAYSVASILLLRNRPYRLIKEQLARGFHYLAEYIHLKANLFPSDPQSQVPIRNQLAQKNIELAQQVETCKNKLYSYSEESGPEGQDVIKGYYRKWFLLQEMQERAISSHEKYDLLTREVHSTALVEGFGQLMWEIGQAMHQYADSLLTDQPYKHPLSLEWTLSAVKKMLEEEKDKPHYITLSLLLRNLTGLEGSLRKGSTSGTQIDVSAFTMRKSEKVTLSSLLTPDHSRFRFAVRLTLTWLLGYGMMHLFHIEKGAWVLLTSLIVFQQTYSATRMRLFHRVFGTFIGVVLGVTLARLLPTLEGQILLLFVSIYLFFYWLRKDYVVAAIFITTYVLASFNILSNQGVAVMWPRIIDTLIGGVLAFLVVRFVWPDWQYKQLPGLLLNAVSKNRRYFESIYGEAVTEEAYLHNRRTAYHADNALASSWKGMRLEPKRMRQYEDKAFNLTNLNHALLSYISAFGVHRHADLTDKEHAFCSEVSAVLGYVLKLLTNSADETQLQFYLEMVDCWEENTENLQTDAENRRVGLIYNVARASRELLIEANEMVKLGHVKV